MEEYRLVDVEIDNFRVTSLAESIRLFKIMEAVTKNFAKEVEMDYDLMLPVYRLEK